ncbi:MAG: hypothetical protein QOE11_2383, partial [Solirubrobacteraceae bacterium]|nr:hypothetical protein [Solirubrobacteraceae bacterium]
MGHRLVAHGKNGDFLLTDSRKSPARR